MKDLSKNFIIKLALDWVVTGLRTLADQLSAMDEDDVAERVDDIRVQLVNTLKGRDKTDESV